MIKGPSKELDTIYSTAQTIGLSLSDIFVVNTMFPNFKHYAVALDYCWSGVLEGHWTSAQIPTEHRLHPHQYNVRFLFTDANAAIEFKLRFG